ncbi:MAG: amidohydrolase family protein [Phycisphaeraceae bacterium]|nr:amidohydrolase family protein [Phycisphaeraceae bacterium]
MANILFHNVRLLTTQGIREDASLYVENTYINDICPTSDSLPDDYERIDGQGMLLSPGMIDLHTHGIHRYLYEQSAEDIVSAASALARHGTTCVLPTLYTVMKRNMLSHLESLAEALDHVSGVSMPGFHLEGPFLRLPGAGSDTVDGDLILLDEILHACKYRVTAMSVSPDTPHIMPVIERLCALGIKVFVTHTQADESVSLQAIDRGARHGTHFYNVFPPPAEHEPGCRPVGIVEALLSDPRCTVDFIADGVHVSPTAIKASLAAKGFANVALITDSNIGAGLPSGIYETTCKYPVRISEGDAARVHLPGDPRHNLLAGSSLTMDRGMNNLLNWINSPIEQVFFMGTSTPARIAGLQNKGEISPGRDADLVLWSIDHRSLVVEQTWSLGQIVYRRSH